jgi:acyl carrier protein
MHNIGFAEVLQQVQFTLCDHLRLPPDRVTVSAALQDDLHIDSLDFAEVRLTLQDLFEVEIEAQRPFRTVFDLAAFLDERTPFTKRETRA